MLNNAGLVQLAKFGIPIVIVIWILGYLTSEREAYTTIVKTRFKSEKEKFIADFLDNEVGSEFNGAGIAHACAQQTWTPGLILSCVPVDGGYAKVKNGHLNCIRFAMEMGAELVLPRIVKRDQKNVAVTRPKNGKGPYVGELLEYLFDYEHLNATLSLHCPQMKLYKSMDDLWDVPQVSPPKKISLSLIETHITNGTVVQDMAKLSDQIKTYINKTAPPETRRMPIRFELDATNHAFPVDYDAPEFANSFGRLLRPRSDARALAAAALYNLSKRFGLVSLPSRNIQNNGFAGVHLRTEADAVGYPNFDTQVGALLRFARDVEARLLFLATGTTPREIKAFTERAQAANLTAITKKDLLDDEDAPLLQAMTWDQRALVDYEIMLRAGSFAGPVESGFSWNLAVTRSTVPGAAEAAAAPVSGLVQYRDAYSAVMGSLDRGYTMKATIWP
ncbi:hypothetical protein QBC42DRAFT_194978 [Cladorrhinum samala]|uniref:Alternative oxidase n=1 Tax=Cladorrhinum samala TaxID=585594 RepID=A0AAV9I031_9PEZI|nr:hypothetical protein QBC42DRAFT_194978 [Cladorrhinum samala]